MHIPKPGIFHWFFLFTGFSDGVLSSECKFPLVFLSHRGIFPWSPANSQSQEWDFPLGYPSLKGKFPLFFQPSEWNIPINASS
jgi:hypothetical protein